MQLLPQAALASPVRSQTSGNTMRPGGKERSCSWLRRLEMIRVSISLMIICCLLTECRTQVVRAQTNILISRRYLELILLVCRALVVSVPDATNIDQELPHGSMSTIARSSDPPPQRFAPCFRSMGIIKWGKMTSCAHQLQMCHLFSINAARSGCVSSVNSLTIYCCSIKARLASCSAGCVRDPGHPPALLHRSEAQLHCVVDCHGPTG